MGLLNRLKTAILWRLGRPIIMRSMRKERSLAQHPGAVLPDETSPHRFEIPTEMMKYTQSGGKMRASFPVRRMLSIVRNTRRSVDSIADNPPTPKTLVDETFLIQLREYARSLGVEPIGFAKLPQNWIFQEFGVLYDDVIVLAMEMGAAEIAKAPSQDTMDMVMETYDELGISSNLIAEFLREHGYAAQAGHPLGGMVLYPPLAMMAGIGWQGAHGLVITPEFGPRVRLTAVYTSIQNLPYTDQNEHAWIEEFCKTCRFCIEGCPPGAVRSSPIVHTSGRVSRVDRDKCFPYFSEFYGCSVCIKVCPFSERPYHQMKESFHRC